MEQSAQPFRALAEGEAEFLVHRRQRRVEVRTELTPRRADRRRGLQRMTTLHRLLARPAVTDRHVELTHDHRLRNVGLVLRDHVRFDERRAVAMRTHVGQRHRNRLVDLVGNRPTGLTTVPLPLLPTRLLRVPRRLLLLAKRRRRPLAQSLQPFHLGLQSRDRHRTRTPKRLELTLQLLPTRRQRHAVFANRFRKRLGHEYGYNKSIEQAQEELR